MISQRALAVDSSGIRRVFDLAQKIENPINLSIGQPDFDVPQSLKLASKSAIDKGFNRYTVTQGIEELRSDIRLRYGLAADGSDEETEVMVTSGVSGGLMLGYMAALDPGDEILIPDPFFCMYRDLALLVNAVPKYYDTYPDFSLKVNAIEPLVTDRTKVIVLNSPSNPTGYSLNEQELAAVIELAQKHDLWLLYDEIYDAFSYDAPHLGVIGKYPKAVSLGGFSKSHGATGWRVGYAAGPRRIINEMLKIQQYTFVCAPSMAQQALVGALDHDLCAVAESYRKKRDFMVSALKDRFELEVPGGAFYVFPKAPGGSGQAFVERCIERNVLVVPGHVFSRSDTHFRISFAAPDSVLEAGAEILNKLAAG